MNHVRNIAAVALLLLLSACGGGGGGGAAGGSSSAASTTVSGIASKGIIKGGAVAVYPVSTDGVKGGTPLAVGTTDADGAYTINIPSYSGAIVVEVSGLYRDEATGKDITVPSSAPLHAVLDYVTTGKSFSLPVTPLTELAYRHAGALTATNIREANDLVSYIMRLDIINTMPVAPTADAFGSATQSQKDYALILAAVSQMMATQGTTLFTTLSTLNNGLDSTEASTAINTALAAFITNPNNLTGVTSVPTTLQNIATIGKKLTLTISENKDKKSINKVSFVQAIAVTLTLPSGLLLRTDAQGVPLASVFNLSGSAAIAAGKQYTARYIAASGSTPATIALVVLVPNGGLTAGDVITITCDTAVNATAPPTSAVTLSKIDLRDQYGAALPESDRPVLSLL